VATYEYECSNDSERVILTRSMTDDEIIPYCDTCSDPMIRIYTAPPVKFNGTGFYSNGG